tara:strand:- start:197 stop:1246 length:1050 start_codon:yes stop_codon:yes gene_type:complete
MEIQQKLKMAQSKVLIIAEAGVNHNGDFTKAIKLIDVAADAGADFVKFQTFKTENLTSKVSKLANYQYKNISNKNDSQFEMLKKLEIPYNWYPKLVDRCKEKNIEFLSTAFDEESLNNLLDLDISLIKIPSGEITNKPYLEHISKSKKKIILSTGMSNLNEVEIAIKILLSNGQKKKDIVVLHCNTEYPTPFEDVNLNSMIFMKMKLGINVGYSDHSLGIEVPIAAVAMGACVVEKHFTLDKNLEGPDHKASLSPDELKSMVQSIRNIEKSLGSFSKKASRSEEKNIIIARKSIHLKKGIKKGDSINREDLVMLRPGDGISPMGITEVIGKKSLYNLKKGHKLIKSDIT